MKTYTWRSFCLSSAQDSWADVDVACPIGNCLFEITLTGNWYDKTIESIREPADTHLREAHHVIGTADDGGPEVDR